MPLWSTQAPAGASGADPGANLAKKQDAYSAGDSFCTCITFFLFLWFTPLSLVLLYHAAPTTVVTLAIVWVMITLLPWASHAGGTVSQDVSGPVLTVTAFMGVILSFLGGVRCYYEHAQPMRQLALAREYSGVYPELPGIGFPDAAYLEFAGDTHIDVSKTVSYQSLDSGLSTICVAPIVSAVSTGRHDFWAIGVGCCGETGEKFDCYDATDASVKTGWVLPHKFADKLWTSLGVYVTKAEYRRDLFVKALEKAEATHGITTPGDEAIFVKWTKDKKQDIIEWEVVAVVMFVVGMLVGLAALSIFMTKLYQRFQTVRKEHRRAHHYGLHGDMANSEEEDITARLQQFMAEAMDNAGQALHDGRDNVGRFMRPKLNYADMCLMVVVMPYVMLMCCVVFSTYMPCSKWGHLVLAPFWSMTFILIIALLATPNRALSGFFLLLCCTAGYYIGNLNYKENMFHYCSVGDRRLYTEVKADANTADYWDAGRLNFDSSTMLSTNHSVGFVYQGTTYCAAPVISTNVACKDATPVTSFMQIDSINASEVAESQHRDAKMHATISAGDAAPSPSFMQRRSSRHHTRRAHARRSSTEDLTEYGGCKNIAPKQIEFWAIGENCCEPRKKFWCDGADLKDARQAVVVRANVEDDDYQGPKIDSDRDLFFQAIDQAVATYHLPVPNRPVLLRWGANSEELRGDWQKRSVGIITMTGLATLLLFMLIAISSFFFMMRRRASEKRMMEDYDSRQATRVQGGDATVYDTPRPSLPPANSAQDLSRPRGGMTDADLEARLKMEEDGMRF